MSGPARGRLVCSTVAVLALALLVGGGLTVAKRLHLRARLAHFLRADGAESVVLAPPSITWPSDLTVKTWIYRDRLIAPFADWGWSAHKAGKDGALRVALASWGGVRFAGEPLSDDYGGLTFRYRAPPRLTRLFRAQLSGDVELPLVVIQPWHERVEPDGWVRVFIPFEQLNPGGHAFSHLVLMAAETLPETWLEVDDVGLTTPPPRPPATPRDVSMAVRCEAKAARISPYIYGIGMAQDQKDDAVWWSGASIRRWGGNPTSRYNWKLGNAWNTASDWYFENVDYVGTPGYSYRTFLDNNAAHGVDTALTVPLIGWVAKDIRSSGFPRSAHPAQDSFDPWRAEAGNGMQAGKRIDPGPPTRTSVAAPPEFVGAWVTAIRERDQKLGRRSVHQYILDNEPNLWNHTHRDVHPEPLTYDELLERTIAYASAIRAADPEAVIAGPAEWGWSNYFYSAKDAAQNFMPPVDRIRHGMTPLVPWYLQKLAEHEKKTGVRLLDVLDLHFYPERVYSAARDRATAALRLRSTRSLWDKTYREESWIAEPIFLLPRMRAWVDESYPGLGISIGEWNFGGETHMSGALAIAEALGRFGAYGVTSAFYWTYPPARSPAAWAFRAYRNFDGRGARFEELSVPTRAGEQTSLFASRSGDAKRWVLVALNFDPDHDAATRLTLGSCVPAGSLRAFAYAGEAGGLSPLPATRDADVLTLTIPAYGLAVVELRSAGESQGTKR